MAQNLIAVVGESGSGKTASVRNLNPELTFIISTTGKRPGIRGAAKKYPSFTVENGRMIGNFYTSSNVEQIGKMIQIIDKKLPNIKTLIIDDFQYVMSFEAMDRAREKGYEKHTDIAQHAYMVLKGSMLTRDDLKIVVCTHSENIGDALNPRYKIKTIGKMLDNVITLEGLFTYVFYTTVLIDEEGKPQYKFITNADGVCGAKSPMGMFKDLYIDNDLQLVINTIEEYENSDE